MIPGTPIIPVVVPCTQTKNKYSNYAKAGFCRLYLESLERGMTLSHEEQEAYLNVANFQWKSSMTRALRQWIHDRHKYITADESARFSCFDTIKHLEPTDALPVTKDVDQRVVLSGLTADVFQRVQDQGCDVFRCFVKLNDEYSGSVAMWARAIRFCTSSNLHERMRR
jgi:hypothetical protein